MDCGESNVKTQLARAVGKLRKQIRARLGEAMTCDEAKNLITIGVLGDLDPADEAALQEHLGGCPSCARAYERSAELRDSARIADEPRMPDWEKSWEVIAGRALPSPRKGFRLFNGPGPGPPPRRLFWPSSSWAISPGAAFSDRFRKTILTAAAFSEADSPLPAFADSLEPVLIDFLNRGETPLPRRSANCGKRASGRSFPKRAC